MLFYVCVLVPRQYRTQANGVVKQQIIRLRTFQEDANTYLGKAKGCINCLSDKLEQALLQMAELRARLLWHHGENAFMRTECAEWKARCTETDWYWDDYTAFE